MCNFKNCFLEKKTQLYIIFNRASLTLQEHKEWVLNAVVPKGNSQYIISGDVSGEVKFWDWKTSHSCKSLTVHRGDMTTFAVHDWVPVFCT
jgi:WD40 repeat protein